MISWFLYVRKVSTMKFEKYIEFIDATKVYKSGEVEIRALDNVSFSIREGELAVIVGESGAGKTTLLNVLGGMDTLTDGHVFMGPNEVSEFNRRQLEDYRRFDVGFVFQFYNLIPNLTARENVEIASQLTSGSIPAEEVLSAVGLKDRMDNFPSQLSGGEQQRVSIARALAKRPKLLLCDEPTGALDYKTGKSVLQLLQHTCRDQGKTVIIITHNSAITAMADRIIRLKSGRVVEVRENEARPIDEIDW